MVAFDNLKINQPKRTPSHKTKSHIVKTKVNGKEKIIGLVSRELKLTKAQNNVHPLKPDTQET